jgi:DNA-binding protein HU-beta
MTKSVMAALIKQSTDISGVAAHRAAGDVMDAIVEELRKTGRFTLPGFGTFTVKETKSRNGVNPRTADPITIKAGRTVRFKASPRLKQMI